MSAAIAPSPVSSPSLSRMLHDCTAHCSLHFSGWIQNAEQALHTTPALPAAIPPKQAAPTTTHRSIASRARSTRRRRRLAAPAARYASRHSATQSKPTARWRYCGWSNYRNLVLGLVCRDTPSLGAAACVLAAFPVLLRCAAVVVVVLLTCDTRLFFTQGC